MGTESQSGNSSGYLPPMIAGVATLVAGAILLAAYDTPFGDSLLYLGFLAGYIYLPGWLVYRALVAEPGGWIRQAALGGGLGYVLGVFAFMFTAAIGDRGLLDFYPLIVGTPALIVAVLRWRSPRELVPVERVATKLAVAIAVVAILAMAYFAISIFAVSPLPGAVNVRLFPDYSWTIALASDALHHWPMMEPGVSGEPMPYHNSIHIHLAMASQVTGIDLSLVFLRLWVLPIVVLTVLQFVETGRSLVRSAVAGLIAAVLTLLAGSWGLPSSDVFFTLLILSPSFLFGLIVFLPLIQLAGDRMRRGTVLSAPGEWVLFAVFTAAASGAKISILPVLIGGVAIFGLVTWIRDRRFPVTALAIGVVLSVAQLVFYLLLYRGHSSGLKFNPGHGIDFLNNLSAFPAITATHLSGLADLPVMGTVLDAVGVLIGAFGLMAASLIGLVWIFRRENRPFSAPVVWLLSVLLAAVAILALVESVATGNQLYFFFYGLAAGTILAAEGLRIAWSRRGPVLEHRRTVIGLLVAWVLVIAVALWLPEMIDDFVDEAAVIYIWLVAGTVLICVAAWRLLPRAAGTVVAVLAVATIMVSLTDTPEYYGKTRLRAHPEITTGYRMTPEIYSGLIWLKEDSPDDSVFIVNKQSAFELGSPHTTYDYPAFSERRAFLAGWGYANKVRDAGIDRVLDEGFNPFAGRKRLNDRAFAGDPGAVEELKDRYGVRYAFIDRVNGDPYDIAALKKLGKVVYESPDAVVLDFDQPPGAADSIPD